MNPFLFELSQEVTILAGQGLTVSGQQVQSREAGAVIARAEYLHSENQYLVRYVGGDHRAVESWWGESALT